MKCRNCGKVEAEPPIFCDLGLQPASNKFVTWEQVQLKGETYFPLKPWYCRDCTLIQLDPWHLPSLHFDDGYVYRSGQSSTWVQHCKDFAAEIRGLGYGSHSLVLEIASNDGTLCKEFLKLGIPAIGVEPATASARQAIANGVPTYIEFMDDKTDLPCGLADIIVANNVLAHVPDLDSFLAGVRKHLKPSGRLSVEVPDVAKLMNYNQFDTIYHEHYSYFSKKSLRDALERRGFEVRFIRDIPTHGGSMRVSAGIGPYIEPKYDYLWTGDIFDYYPEPIQGKQTFLKNLLLAKKWGWKVCGYGAPAKANTLLNYCGVGPELMDFLVDSTPEKQNKFTPGTHVPIYSPEVLSIEKPNLIVIMAWNWAEEIRAKLSDLPWSPTIITPLEEWSSGFTI